jgi:solute carrier family 25 carnitine/acylcarnitine transporter 20/29
VREKYCWLVADKQSEQGVIRELGVGGCYAGLGPTLARAFPANAAAIVAWEYSAKILGIKRG